MLGGGGGGRVPGLLLVRPHFCGGGGGGAAKGLFFRFLVPKGNPGFPRNPSLAPLSLLFTVAV